LGQIEAGWDKLEQVGTDNSVIKNEFLEVSLCRFFRIFLFFSFFRLKFSFFSDSSKLYWTSEKKSPINDTREIVFEFVFLVFPMPFSLDDN
jgi:hypothetical protein